MVATVSSQLSRRAESPAESPAKRLKHSHGSRPEGIDGFKSEFLTLKGNTAPSKASSKRFDESRAVVGNGATTNGDVDINDEHQSVLSISSDEEDAESDEEEDEDTVKRPNGTSKPTRLKDLSAKSRIKINGEITGAIAPEDTDAAFQSIFDKAFPEGPIDVEAALESDDDGPNNQLVQANTAISSVPNATTLTTVLTQALRTNDASLLESCLSLNDLDSIRGTIEKLPSPLVASLITRLAERMYKRPGRAGSLMVWVQWALVAHGGYLASQPDVLEMLARVRRVTSERAAGLPLLLELKGRLDMLSAQLELRRGVEARVRAERGDGEDEAVIYVEGEESSSEDEDDERDDDDELGEPETSGDEMDLPNGVDASESDEEDSDADQMFDDEAEETDDDDDDDGEKSEDAFDDDLDDGEGLSEEEKPMKRSMAAGKQGFSRR